MARRARGQEEYQGPGAGRRPRRRSGYEGLYLALGGAAVVALVLVLVISGGSGGDAEIRAASDAFENFIDAILKGQYDRSMGLTSLEGLLVDHDPVLMKERTTMSPAQWKKVKADLYKELTYKVKEMLHLKSSTDVRSKILAKGEATWDSYHKWVQIRWKAEGFDKIIAERRYHEPPRYWLARFREIDRGWRLIKLAPEK